MMIKNCLNFFCITILLFLTINGFSLSTYAERLGYLSGKKVLSLHVDDAGMSWDSNQGTIKSIEEGVEVPLPDLLKMIPVIAQKIWSSGLPVLDDLHKVSGRWHFPKNMERTDQNLQKFYTRKYIETIEQLESGLTMVIMHCTEPSEIFSEIPNIGDRKRADMLA